MISGRTRLIADLGHPTESFKAPLIYNPYFDKRAIDAAVVPLGVKAADYPAFLKLLFRLSNVDGALVTMPHKSTTVALLDELRETARVAGACNAVRREPDGRLVGDMFDGEGFVRGLRRKGRRVEGAGAIVVGSGGVGSAIAASLALAGAARLAVYDVTGSTMERLADRLRVHFPKVAITTGTNDPAGFDIVVNATPLGMMPGDAMPVDVDRIDTSAFVGEVVTTEEITPFLAEVRARGCDFQVGTDMLYEQIPAYLEFFGFPAATPEDLREVSAGALARSSNARAPAPTGGGARRRRRSLPYRSAATSPTSLPPLPPPASTASKSSGPTCSPTTPRPGRSGRWSAPPDSSSVSSSRSGTSKECPSQSARAPSIAPSASST
jgi:shikimate dehydrogenase